MDKMYLLKKIKSRSTDGFAARTEIVLKFINSIPTIHVYQTFLTDKETSLSMLMVKRGKYYIYRNGIALKPDTFNAFAEAMNDIIDVYFNKN